MAKNKNKKKNPAAEKAANGYTATKKTVSQKNVTNESSHMNKAKKRPVEDNKLAQQTKPTKKMKPKTPCVATLKNKVSAVLSRLSLGKKTVPLILCAGVLVFSVCFAVVSGYNEFLLKKVGVSYAAILQRESVYDINIDADAVKQRVKDTDRNGQKSSFAYFCEEKITFRNCTQYGALIFANPETNDCDLVVTLLDKDGHLLYRSDGIAPGKYLSQIRLFAGLEAGEHTCRLYVAGFDRETRKPVGVQYTKLKIIVEENLDG